MFIGHFAVGFGAKKFAPRTSLALLLAAPLLGDILWPIFLLLGWEHARVDPGNTKFTPLDLYDYPWSHSLLMCCIWATLFAVVYLALARYRPGAVAMGIGVVSHWILDWITHRPDMPLYPGSAKYGLGLWNSIWGTMTVEIALFAIGIALYVSVTRARDRVGRWAFGIFVALLMFVYVANLFGGAPENPRAEVAWPAVIAPIVLLTWAWWFDHHRALREGSAL